MEVVKPERFFHERFGLSDRALERVLGTALGRRADWADLYFEFRVNQTASLEEGVVRKATRNVSQGVGVRVVAGARSGYAHSDEVSRERLELAARAARAITDERGAATALPATRAAAAAHDLYPVARPPIDTPTADQVALLQRLDAAARAVDPCITNVFAGIGIEHRVVLVVSSAGAVVGDVRPLVHVSVTCIAERGGRREQGSYGGGGRYAFDTLLDGRAERFAREAARQALTNLAAADAPAGTMTVVLGPGWPGVLLHEAIGHGLEGGFNRKRVSAFADRGLYAVYFGGGQVDITSGKFVFSASEAYLIEGGKVTRPVRGATLIGNGPDVLTRITRVGADLRLDEGIGTCGKDGQSVPVGVGLPTVRIDGLTVGGTQA